MNRYLKVAAVLMLMAPSAFAATIVINDKIKLNLGVTAQLQLAIYEHGAQDTNFVSGPIDSVRYNNRGVGWDFGFRRLRFNLGGSFYNKVDFYFQFESANLGIGNSTNRGFLGTSAAPGNSTVNPVYVQDIFLTYTPFRELIIDAGLMMPAVTHISYKSSASYTSVETHGFFTKYPTSSGTGIITQGGSLGSRDIGVQIRGTVFKNYFQYRLGVYAGNRSVNVSTPGTSPNLGTTTIINPQGYPRIAGNVRFNLWDAEEGFFSNGVYFGKKKLLSLGFGVDYQQNGAYDTSQPVPASSTQVGKNGINTDSVTLGGDLVFDYPFGRDNQHEVILQVNVANYNQGVRRDANGNLIVSSPLTGGYRANANSGTALVVEAGYRWQKLLPAFTYERFFSVTTRNDYEAFRGTIGWLVDGWRTKFQLELAGVRDSTLGAVSQTGNVPAPTTANPNATRSVTELNPATTPYQFQARLQAHFLF